MRILVAGDWHSELHEEAVYWAFTELGHQVVRFPWHHYFKPVQRGGLMQLASTLNGKLQNKFIIGPHVSRLNRDFCRAMTEFEPEMVFLYRGTHILPDTLRVLKREHPQTFIVGYNNDDPFSEGNPYWLWRHFIAAIPHYDMLLAYRHHNLEDFRKSGARQAHLLRSWFMPKRNHPMSLSTEESERFGCDVVFIGHYEADGRLAMLEEVVRQGFHLRLYGPGYDWDPVIRKSPVLRSLAPVRLVWGEEYNKALCGAKVALCFLSKLNRDTYTRRCFEIPASGTLMLSEYTDDLASLYKEGMEADFFRDTVELIGKLKRYVDDADLRTSVAKAGSRRVIEDGHDVIARMKQVLTWVAQTRE